MTIHQGYLFHFLIVDLENLSNNSSVNMCMAAKLLCRFILSSYFRGNKKIVIFCDSCFYYTTVGDKMSTMRDYFFHYVAIFFPYRRGYHGKQ